MSARSEFTVPASRTSKPSAPGHLVVADSFRVRRHGASVQVRGLTRHRERFRGAVLTATQSFSATQAFSSKSRRDSNIDSNAVDVFLDRALEQLSHLGDGFPRWELWQVTNETDRTAQLELAQALRPLPQLATTITLHTSPAPPGLTSPDRKGPNIASYAALARAAGGEVAMLDAQGLIIEGTTTSLVWWDATGRGHVSSSRARVPSVTEALISELAATRGTPLTPLSVPPADLAHCEVWAVNALHGIRPVLSIDERPQAAPDQHRLTQYRAALDGTWQSVRAASR